MTQNFIKRIESFTCKTCGMKVVGDGYTNHCPNCLWSKHVDEIVPGDRASDCKGLMEPIRAELKGGEYILTHKCQKCKKMSRNKTSEEDNFDEILRLL